MKKNGVKYICLCFVLLVVGFNVWLVTTEKLFFYDALRYNFVDIDDYTLFSNRTISKSEQPKVWPFSKSYSTNVISDSLKRKLEIIETVAFLIIQNDSITHEMYWSGYNEKSWSNSFSMAKSYIGALIGIAIQEGKLKSVDQPVADFLPSFQEGKKSKITIRHLLMMSSGLDWEEAYASPFSATTEAYYGKDLYKQVSMLKAVEEPGKIFRYKSCDTQLLSFVLEKATGMKVAEYASEKLWKKIGCEQDALWSLDKENGNEKAYCCLNSNARDFAKLGKLYLDSGRVGGESILSVEYVKGSIHPHGLPDGDLDYKPSNFYGYQWWTIPDYKGHFVFYARGILGQYIIVIPDKKIIIVRLGHKRGAVVGKHYSEVFSMLDEVL